MTGQYDQLLLHNSAMLSILGWSNKSRSQNLGNMIGGPWVMLTRKPIDPQVQVEKHVLEN